MKTAAKILPESLPALEHRFGRRPISDLFELPAAPVVVREPAPVYGPMPAERCCRWQLVDVGVCSECLAARGGK